MKCNQCLYPVLREQKNIKKHLLISVESSIINVVLNETMSSDDGKEVTPVPIPNTEVKLFSADGSWGLPPVRV